MMKAGEMKDLGDFHVEVEGYELVLGCTFPRAHCYLSMTGGFFPVKSFN